jgi:hypothetical protein
MNGSYGASAPLTKDHRLYYYTIGSRYQLVSPRKAANMGASVVCMHKSPELPHSRPLPIPWFDWKGDAFEIRDAADELRGEAIARHALAWSDGWIKRWRPADDPGDSERDRRRVPLEYHPRTPLGQRLWELRQKIVASGIPLLTWDEIEREVRDRRGEHEVEEY